MERRKRQEIFRAKISLLKGAVGSWSVHAAFFLGGPLGILGVLPSRLATVSDAASSHCVRSLMRPGSSTRATFVPQRPPKTSQRGSVLKRRALLHVSPKREPSPPRGYLNSPEHLQAHPARYPTIPPGPGQAKPPELLSNLFATTSLLLLRAIHSCALPPASLRALFRCQGRLLPFRLFSSFSLQFLSCSAGSFGHLGVCNMSDHEFGGKAPCQINKPLTRL